MHRLLYALLALSLTGCSIISELTEQNNPTIESFTLTPEEGAAPLEVLFNWGVSDLDGDNLTCRLDYGDGDLTQIANCSGVNDEFHVYQEPGRYIAKFSASDGGDEVSQTAAVIVLEDDESDPSETDFAITSFVAQPNQGAAPLQSVLSWTLQGEGPATCTLSFDDGSDDEVTENCDDITESFHTFEDEGGYRVILEATDGDTTVRKSLVVVVGSGS